MSRFEKKCFIGSATFHGLLLVVFLFGSAFLNSPPKDMGPVLEFVPGGLPVNSGPPPAPAQPAPQTEQPQPPKVEPVKQPEPQPPKPPEAKRVIQKETEKEKGSLPVPIKAEKKDAPKEAAKPKSSVSTTVVRRSNVVDKAAIQLAQAQRDKMARDAREAQARRAQTISDINSIITGVNNGVSRSTVVSSGGVDSAGGVASGRYGDGLKSIYDSKWILNADAYDDETAASVRVRVRRDGSVVSATVTKPSGNAAFDRSVRATLNAVEKVMPFPAEMKDAEREFTWKFERKTRVG